MVHGEEFLPQRGQTGLECVFDRVRKAGDGRSLGGDVAGEEAFDHTHGTGCGEAAAGRDDLIADRIEHLTFMLAERDRGWIAAEFGSGGAKRVTPVAAFRLRNALREAEMSKFHVIPPAFDPEMLSDHPNRPVEVETRDSTTQRRYQSGSSFFGGAYLSVSFRIMSKSFMFLPGRSTAERTSDASLLGLTTLSALHPGRQARALSCNRHARC